MNSKEVCRLSWFIVDTQYEKTKPNNENRYFLIHSVDLYNSDVSSMYINRLVKFKYNGKSMEGTLLLASDDYCYMQTELEALKKNMTITEYKKESINNVCYLIQYQKEDAVKHIIVQHKDLFWKLDKNTKEDNNILQFITNNKKELSDDLLSINATTSLDLREFVEPFVTDGEKKQLVKLKDNCFNLIYTEIVSKIDLSRDPWMLLQFTNATSAVYYKIMKYNKTVRQAENLYKDVVAYIQMDGIVYQGIILLKSYNCDIIRNALQILSEYALPASFSVDYDLIEEMIVEETGQRNELESNDLPTSSIYATNSVRKIKQPQYKIKPASKVMMNCND
ncbi:early boundary activity protein 3 [Teleopsis dalmanni]|uniref:early boundary activity protein 3 n=1 Tax=Teleopsis dalmanni TaxID=139649 RepID=UPI0018CF4B5D|nr:early boundary activity protein 3 [Teleopsis dalmanni]